MRLQHLLPFLLFSVLFMVYLLTLAPGLTWSFDGADGGDFLTAIATGGVPHPSGYPTYLLFLSIFTHLPFGDLAWKANLFSALCTAWAALVVYAVAVELTDDALSALAGGLAFGFFPLVWSQALITEVYALQGLLSVLVLYFLLKKEPHHFWGGLLAGLALGNHLTGIFLFPLLLFNLRQPAVRTAAYRLGGLLVGLGVFLVIPIRAASNAPVNWGLARDWQSLVWLLTGAMYHSRVQPIDLGYLVSGIKSWSEFMIWQAGVPGLAAGFLGLVFSLKPTQTVGALVWLFASSSVFAIMYDSPDWYVYLVPALIVLALWTSQGANWLANNLPLPKYSKLAIVLALLYISARAGLAFQEMDLSRDQAPELFAQSVLKQTPANAIILTRHDEDTFPLWYFHFGLRQRPDVVIVSTPLYSHDWYREILDYTYPSVEIPEDIRLEVLISRNTAHPVCEIDGFFKPQLSCKP